MPKRFPGGEIAALRARLGLSQAAFGKRFGVNQATVSRWEGGTQKPEPGIRNRLIELRYRLGLSGGVQPEIALVEYSPFPMAIVSQDWSILALSEAVLNREGAARRERWTEPSTADMEQAVSILRARGFFDGKVAACRIVARGFLLSQEPACFEAICTPVSVDGQICRLMQYSVLSDGDFMERRDRLGLVTLLGGGTGEAGD